MNAAIAQLFASYSNIIDLCLLNSLIGYGLFLALSANMFSLATGGFMALGAYCSVYMTMELGLPFAPASARGRESWGRGGSADRHAGTTVARRPLYACDLRIH